MNTSEQISGSLTKRSRSRSIRPKSNIGPIASLASNALAARVWFAVALIEATALVVVPYAIVSKMKESERIVIVDESGTFHVAPLLGFEQASKLHAYHATLASLAFLQRNPQGIDFPELFDRIFMQPAYEEAKRLIQSEAEEFVEKSIRQKPEISKIKILETRSDEVLVLVHGQLIRLGLFGSKPFQEGLDFKMELVLARNPRLTQNGRLPLAVHRIQFKQWKP